MKKKTLKGHQKKEQQKLPLAKAAAAEQPEERERELAKPDTLQQMLNEAMVKSNVQVFVVRITPELAETLLGNNDGNRPLKKRVLETYARDMEAGDFVLTGETIILSDKWKTMNGQHRLNACILAKKPFDAVVIQGLPERVYLKLDSGEKRRAADWLSSGSYAEPNAKVFAAALKLVWQWENGALCSNKRYPSNDELAHVLDQNGGIRAFNSSTFAKSVKGCPGSLVLGLRYIFGQYDNKVAGEFFEKLATGEGLKRGDPILLLRDKLADKERGRTQEVIAAVMIKAWNAWLSGETITAHHLRFRTGKGGEEMPRILGVDIEFKGKVHTAK